MKLLLLERSLWDVTAMVEERSEAACPLTDFLYELDASYEASRDGMFDLFRRFAEGGRNGFNDGLCHVVNDDEKIFEFIKGDLRVLWFYAKGANRIIVCSHGFVKKGKKAPVRDIDRAISAKKAYEEAARANQITIVEE